MGLRCAHAASPRHATMHLSSPVVACKRRGSGCEVFCAAPGAPSRGARACTTYSKSTSSWASKPLSFGFAAKSTVECPSIHASKPSSLSMPIGVAEPPADTSPEPQKEYTQ